MTAQARWDIVIGGLVGLGILCAALLSPYIVLPLLRAIGRAKPPARPPSP